MFTDIVGFSQLLQYDETKGQEALQRHLQTLQEIQSHYGGQLIQYGNDTSLSIFSSTAAAVECAVAIQVKCRKEPRLLLRIGIHTGDITYDEQGGFGEGVTLAKLIEGLCKPGAVYVSEKAYDDIRGSPMADGSWIRHLSPPANCTLRSGLRYSQQEPSDSISNGTAYIP